MQVARKLLAGLAVATMVTTAGTAYAQVVTAQGMGSVPYSGHGTFGKVELAPADKQAAIAKAEANAIDYYFANQGSSSNGNYDAIKGQIDANLDKYVLGYVVLGEKNDPDSATYTVTLRANINGSALSAALNKSSATAATAAANRSYVMFVFVSRQIASTKTFDPHVYKRTDVKQQVAGNLQTAGSNRSSESNAGSEGQSINGNQIRIGDSKSSAQDQRSSATFNGGSEASTSVETGGSVEHKSSQTTWRIFPSANLDSVIEGELTRDGYSPVSEAYVEPATNGVLKISEINADYSTGNDLSPETLQHIVIGAKTAKVPYVALGTLDVDQTQTNPATGLFRVGVTVNAKVLDLSGMFPHPIGAVGPVQYFGNGPTENSAQIAALKEAGTAAAKDLAGQMQAAGFH